MDKSEAVAAAAAVVVVVVVVVGLLLLPSTPHKDNHVFSNPVAFARASIGVFVVMVLNE